MTMQQALSIAWEWRYPLLAVFVAIAYLSLNWRYAWAKLKEITPQLMLLAQKRAKELLLADGEARMAWVVQYIMTAVVPTFPIWLRSWFTEQRVRVFAQWVYDTAIDLLDDGQANGSTAVSK